MTNTAEEPPFMSEAVLTYRGCVYPWHCDHMGHMNVMWYVGKFDEATWHFLAGIGLTPQSLRSSNRGMVAVEQLLKYERELIAGDLVSVYSRMVELRAKSIRFEHEMRNEATGEVAATCTLTGVHIDTASRKAVALPEHVATRSGRVIERD
jgi:acyl-CoA thioester hydrolase